MWGCLGGACRATACPRLYSPYKETLALCPASQLDTEVCAEILRPVCRNLGLGRGLSTPLAPSRASIRGQSGPSNGILVVCGGTQVEPDLTPPSTAKEKPDVNHCHVGLCEVEDRRLELLTF